MSSNSLIRAPHALERLRHGFDELARLLALTLGPTRGVVLVDIPQRPPEVLTDSGDIARRVIELPVRGVDAGAMLLRQAVWTMHERYGDGAATVAVLAQAMVCEAARMIAAGADPMLLRRGIERGVAAASGALVAQTQPGSGQVQLTRMATSITGDPALGVVLGEMFDVLGPHAALTVEEFAAPYLEREYVDGGRWPAQTASRALMPDEIAPLVLHNPYILVADQELQTVAHVRSALAALVDAAAHRPLLIVARGIGGEALTTLVINHTQGRLSIGAAILRFPGFMGDDLSDIALLTGAKVYGEMLGAPPQQADLIDLGTARRVTLDRDGLTIVGGGGDAGAIRRRVDELRSRLAALGRMDGDWERLRLRVARLAGGIGVLKIGAFTPTERALKVEQARKAVRTLDLALNEGVVPGGGVAYLNCSAAVRASEQACRHPDEAHGVAIVAAALETPFMQIVRNHGIIHPAVALNTVRRLGPEYGFDAVTGQYVDIVRQGVIDCTAVLRGALETAGSAASMTITTELLVLVPAHRREQRADP